MAASGYSLLFSYILFSSLLKSKLLSLSLSLSVRITAKAPQSRTTDCVLLGNDVECLSEYKLYIRFIVICAYLQKIKSELNIRSDTWICSI